MHKDTFVLGENLTVWVRIKWCFDDRSERPTYSVDGSIVSDEWTIVFIVTADI